MNRCQQFIRPGRDDRAGRDHLSIALPFIPNDAFNNIQRLRTLYPDIYGPYGYYDAVNPTTGQVGHRYLVLDEGMLFAFGVPERVSFWMKNTVLPLSAGYIGPDGTIVAVQAGACGRTSAVW